MLPQEPVPEVPPPPSPVLSLPDEDPPVRMAPVPHLIAFVPPVLPVRSPKVVARVERLPNVPSPKPEPVTQPIAMIKEAQRAAHVEPSARGFHGSSATQRWIWQPGKLYVVYVAPTQTTRISLPPGELLISKVFLDPELWDIQSYRVGNETQTQDVVFVATDGSDRGEGCERCGPSTADRARA